MPSYRNKMIKFSKQRQLDMAASALAHEMAKEVNDPMEKKYQRLWKKVKELKKKIRAKYGNRAMTKVRQRG